jgi:hypothetical protein
MRVLQFIIPMEWKGVGLKSTTMLFSKDSEEDSLRNVITRSPESSTTSYLLPSERTRLSQSRSASGLCVSKMMTSSPAPSDPIATTPISIARLRDILATVL